jgi:hypothetical protein
MITRVAIGALVFLATAPAASADVHLSIRNGRVTLQATNATVRQILTEWARVGQTRIVNVERIPGGPLTLELTNVPEREALDLLLRSVTGYLAAARAVAAPELSQFDRILVLPTAAIPRSPATAAAPSPVFGGPPPIFVQPPIENDNEDGPSVQPARGPLFPTFPQAVVNPAQGGAAPAFAPAQLTSPIPYVGGRPADGAANGGGQPASGASSAPAVLGSGTVGTPRPGMVVQPAPAPPQPQTGQ